MTIEKEEREEKEKAEKLVVEKTNEDEATLTKACEVADNMLNTGGLPAASSQKSSEPVEKKNNREIVFEDLDDLPDSMNPTEGEVEAKHEAASESKDEPKKVEAPIEKRNTQADYGVEDMDDLLDSMNPTEVAV